MRCKRTTAGQLCTVGCPSSALLTMHVLVSLNHTVMTADAHAMQSVKHDSTAMRWTGNIPCVCVTNSTRPQTRHMHHRAEQIMTTK